MMSSAMGKIAKKVDANAAASASNECVVTPLVKASVPKKQKTAVTSNLPSYQLALTALTSDVNAASDEKIHFAERRLQLEKQKYDEDMKQQQLHMVLEKEKVRAENDFRMFQMEQSKKADDHRMKAEDHRMKQVDKDNEFRMTQLLYEKEKKR